MDFSQLSDLHVAQDNDDLYTRLMEVGMSEIRHLSSRRLNLRVEFLQGLPPLESLCIHMERRMEVFPLTDILDVHGPSLRSLVLRQEECERPPRRSVLETIRTRYPQLRHSGLRIDQGGAWPNATRDKILSFPDLTSLTDELELGMDLHVVEDNEYAYGFGRNPFWEPGMASRADAERVFWDWREMKKGRQLGAMPFGRNTGTCG